VHLAQTANDADKNDPKKALRVRDTVVQHDTVLHNAEIGTQMQQQQQPRAHHTQKRANTTMDSDGNEEDEGPRKRGRVESGRIERSLRAAPSVTVNASSRYAQLPNPQSMNLNGRNMINATGTRGNQQRRGLTLSGPTNGREIRPA
jgi:hypothetical protein